MKRLALRLLQVLLIVLMAVAGVLVLAVDRAPLVVGQAAFTPEHIHRARWLLARNDPRRLHAGESRTIVVSQEDLALTANYLANRFARGAGEIVLKDGHARVRASVALPIAALRGFVNLDASFRETQALPKFERLWLGQLPVPAFLCNWLLERGLRYLRASADYSALPDVVQEVRSKGGFLTVRIVWNDTVTAQLKSALVDKHEQQRWRAYQARLAELTRRPGASHVMPLDQLLVPLLQLASQRANAGASLAAENRAALTVLAFYVNGRSLTALVSAARAWPWPRWRFVTLAGRTDSPRHFMVSAALAATAGSPLADAIGLYKELDDARRSSGFSFNDLAANRAGTRLGEIAVSGGRDAAPLQRELARGLDEADLLPMVQDLPESLSMADFHRRFGGIEQPAFQAMVAEIERRIATLPLYR